MSEDEILNLLLQIARQDEGAFRKLYMHYYTKLFQFSHSICKNKQWAEEVTEDVFIKIWRNHKTAPQIQNLKVYLYTAIKNTTLNYIAQQARRNITEPFGDIDIELTENPADSIIEKETGTSADRALISAVFNNRLRIGMRLQTDPTVIFGLGEAFDGNLRKVDLLTDTPWNTYTRTGLPPTPIAIPGKAALLAAVQPGPSKALYFVARGDGSSVFSESLDAHNRAVNKYQRGQ